ncbi:hypothetical protein [Dyella sp. ASV21]|uniref:hypothetical protein n=1 Tax=Dyella sp. ASV21 TaxID=2795114 RepID=UPI0018ECA198|nr:hypothetical protein [Dyella sp. ASV21]
MNLSELLQKLSYGQLSELPIAGEGTGVVPEANIPKLVVRINDALAKLYARFDLQKRTVILETVDGVYAYQLAPQFAQTSGSSEPNKYLKDTVANPFLDDVLQVTAILANQAALPTDPNYITTPRLDENDYIPMPLNDVEDRLSWHTLSFDTLAMDYPKTGDRYFIQYRAKHAPIPLKPDDLDKVQIRIPSQLETALLSHIAGNVYAGMSMEMSLAKSQQLLALYEAECKFHEERDTFTQFNESGNVKPLLGGWV